jgi:hypothetical protein
MDPRGKEKELNQRTAPDIPLRGVRREKRSQKYQRRSAEHRSGAAVPVECTWSKKIRPCSFFP